MKPEYLFLVLPTWIACELLVFVVAKFVRGWRRHAEHERMRKTFGGSRDRGARAHEDLRSRTKRGGWRLR